MGVVPKALQNRPTPRPDSTKYRKAFSRVSAAREFSEVGPQSVTVTEVLSYMNLIGEYDPSEREVYLNHIQAMDAVFLDYMRKKMEKDRPKPKG